MPRPPEEGLQAARSEHRGAGCSSRASILTISVPVTTLVGALGGCLIALSARRGLIRAHDPVRTRYFVVSVLFGSAVLLPAGMALYLAFPDWSLMYLANPAHLPGWIVFPVLLLAYAGGAPVTFLATARLMTEPKPWPLRTLVGAISLFLSAVLLLGWDRLTTVAYYDAFHHNLGAFSIFSSALLLPLILTTGAVGGVLYFSLRHIRRHLDMLEDLPPIGTSRELSPTAALLGANTGQVKEPAGS